MRLLLLCFLNKLTRIQSDPSIVIPNIEAFYKNGELDLIARSKLFLQYRFPYELNNERYKDHHHLESFRLNGSLSYFAGSDIPFNFWSDVTHDSSKTFVNLDGYMAFLQSNPVHRRVEYAGNKICGNDYQELYGVRISQIYTLPGLPFEIPCFTCQKNLTGSLGVIHVTSSFHLDIAPDRGLTEPPSTVQSAFSWLIENYGSLYHRVLQLFSYSYVNFSPLLHEKGGRLQVSPLKHLMKEFDQKARRKGQSNLYDILNGGKLSYHCLVDMDNNYVDTGVVVKVDVIQDEQGAVKHRHFEAWDSNYKAFEDPSSNIKIDISWEEFGCCSACCCTHELCGLYSSMKNCKSVFSKKVRKGYLSIMKLDSKREVSLQELNEFFSVSPYMEKGVPLYSTILKPLAIARTIQNWKNSFNNLNKISSYKGMGVYIEEKSCANDPQKLDCFELAKCKGILLKTEEEEKEKFNEDDVDPCAALNMTTIIIKESQSLYRVQEGQNYRIQLDPLIFNTDQGVKWKFSLDFVPSYRSKQDCSEQDRSIHPNGKDLLILGLSKRDINKKIEASTLDGMKARFELKNENENAADGWKTFTVVLWGAMIMIFFSLIMMFVLVIEGTKTKRIQRILTHKNNGNKEAEFGQESQPSTF